MSDIMVLVYAVIADGVASLTVIGYVLMDRAHSLPLFPFRMRVRRTGCSYTVVVWGSASVSQLI